MITFAAMAVTRPMYGTALAPAVEMMTWIRGREPDANAVLSAAGTAATVTLFAVCAVIVVAVPPSFQSHPYVPFLAAEGVAFARMRKAEGANIVGART